MADKKQASTDDPSQEFDPTHIDPSLERKVDEMMNSDIAADETNETLVGAAEEPVSTSAPLLPTEKLQKIQILHDETVPDKKALASDIAKNKPKKKEAPEDSPTEPSESTAEIEADEGDPAKELGLDDPETGKLVDSIVAHEADELLAAEDAQAGKAPEALPLLAAQADSKPRRRGFMRAWWSNRLYRWLTVVLLGAAIAVATAVPASRYFILNNLGARASSSMVIRDQATRQPLKNVEVSLSGQTSKTDKDGKVHLQNLKLGSQTLIVKKVAYADANKSLVIGWGSNPLGDFHLKAVGTKYKFKVTDFLSKKPIAKAEASSGEASALSNEKGEIVLTVPQTGKDRVEVEIKAENYRIEKRTLSNEQKETAEVQLVPYKKHVFISKRSGTYDVYKVDVDGKNEEKVLAGNGSEQIQTMSLSSHPTKNMAALISSRDNIKNSDGYNMSTLTLIDLNDNSATKITQSERIQLIDWVGDRLIYVKVAEGSKPDSTERNRLVSYDLASETEKELASTNYFNDMVAVKGAVYYSPAAYNVNGSVGLFKINIDGSNKKTVYDKEVWKLLRTSYDKLSVSMGEEWFELNLDNDALTRQDGSPAVQKTRVYFDGPGNAMSLWVDERDGKGTLLKYDQKSKSDKVIQSQAGLKNPVRWLSEKHVIYRISNNQETADYILNTDGGEARKIRDVTDTAGIDRWYYY